MIRSKSIKVLLILLLSVHLPLWANMASPIQEGTQASSPFISQHVEIKKESIRIVPDQNFESALFQVVYYIEAAQAGQQIPLLFYAAEYQDEFKMKIDGKEIGLKTVPDAYQDLEGTQFSDFSYLFDTDNPGENAGIHIDESANSGYYLYLHNLKYFEVDIDSGPHTIEVEYYANRWTDLKEWVKKYSFRYALAPAKYWKSFGELEITLDNTQFGIDLTTNLGPPTEGELEGKASWYFDKLPVETLAISYQPEMPGVAKFLLAVSPAWLSIILGLILLFVQLGLMKRMRKIKPLKRPSWILFVGSLVVPAICLLFYLNSYDWIDDLIGADASRYHGYHIMVIFLYPVLMLGYFTFTWFYDKWVARKYKSIGN